MPYNYELPPLGLMPQKHANILRLKNIDEAIQRYIEAKMIIPEEWIEERNGLLDWLNDYNKEKSINEAKNGVIIELKTNLDNINSVEDLAKAIKEGLILGISKGCYI